MQKIAPTYHDILDHCRGLFVLKNKDYGDAWRFFRPVSLLDQIYIKAFRIRNIQHKGKQMIADSIADEYAAIVNYAIIGFILEERCQAASQGQPIHPPITETELVQTYDRICAQLHETYTAKNTDYDQAWTNLHPESFVDIILVKIARAHNIVQNNRSVVVSEPISSIYIDIANYAIFALIKLNSS